MPKGKREESLKKQIEQFDFDNVEFGKFILHPQSSSLPKVPFRLCVWLMVRDEASFVEKSLLSAATVADCIVVADTGSTDGTVDKVISVCQTIKKPFYIVQIGDPKYNLLNFPFFNFAAYRNRILQFVEPLAEWLLAIDASDEIRNGHLLLQALSQIPERFSAGVVQLLWNDYAHGFQRLLRSRSNLRYKDARHNYFDLKTDEQVDLRSIGFCLYQDRSSAKSSKSKFKKDIEYFEWKLKYFPDDRRAMFYLAESYYNDNLLSNAYKQYQKCSVKEDMWCNERYVSHLRCAEIVRQQHRDFQTIESHLLNAYNTIATPLAAIELYRLYRDDQRKEKEYFGPRLNQAYAFIMAACYCKDAQCFLHEKPREVDETRWALLAHAAFEKGDVPVAIDGYIRAQYGHLLYENVSRYYAPSFQLCWNKFGKDNWKEFQKIPVEFISATLAAEIKHKQ